MIKNTEFTKEYLDTIIVASEQHSVNEWLAAFNKLSEIMRELNLDERSMGTESLKANLAENESRISLEVGRFNACAESVLSASMKIAQEASREGLRYEDVSELVRSAWWELSSLFDYAPELYVNIYSLCLFKNLALTLEKSVKLVADRL